MTPALGRYATKPLPVVGHMLAMARDPLGLLTRLAAEQGEFAPIVLGREQGLLLTHPDLVDQVLRTKTKHYSRETRVYKAMMLALGHGILTSEGEHWRKHRRIVQPAFHRQRLTSFAGAMTRITGAALGSLRGEVDASATMMRLTLEIVSDTLLGVRTDRDAEEIGRAIDDVQRYLESAIAGIALPLRVPTPQNRRVSRAIAALDRTADRLIAEKRRSPGDDVLTMLVEARDEDGAPLPDRQIRDELLTLLSAGHETTANALSWTLLLLAQHPAERRRLEEEVDRVLGGEVPTLDSLPKLQYTRFVIDEALRLYPPAWATGRVAMQPHVLEIEGGSPRGVQRGTVVILSPWVTHRRPDLWENAEAFDPERWRALSAPGAVHPFAFFPFGGGPRKCVGEAFAYLEATIVIAMIAQRMRLDLVPGQSIEPSPQITLGTKNGLRMRVVPR